MTFKPYQYRIVEHPGIGFEPQMLFRAPMTEQDVWQPLNRDGYWASPADSYSYGVVSERVLFTERAAAESAIAKANAVNGDNLREIERTPAEPDRTNSGAVVGQSFNLNISHQLPESAIVEDCVFYTDPDEHAKWLKSPDGIAWLDRVEKPRATAGEKDPGALRIAAAHLAAFDWEGMTSPASADLNARILALRALL